MAGEDFTKLMKIWVRIVSKINEADCQKRDYGTGDLLSPAEIHLLQAIAMNQGKKVTDIATYLGVTKGAVSQMVKKLEARNLIVKYTGAGNEKEILLRLSRSGRIAQQGHDKHHMRFMEEVEKAMGEITEDQAQVLESFLTAVEKCIDDFNTSAR